jgi:alpha,alpha-trehalase
MSMDYVDQCGIDSFPAGDPPSWWTGKREVAASEVAVPLVDPPQAIPSVRPSATVAPGRPGHGRRAEDGTAFDPGTVATVWDSRPSFRPLRYRDGYLPVEDLGLIGDGTTAALVGLDGTIPWLCLPRFDSEALFCGLLDRREGGCFRLAPEDIVEARQRYEPDTAVLVTELRSPTGLVRVTDALALQSGADLAEGAAERKKLVRSAVVLDGHVRLRVDVEPRGGAAVTPAAGGLEIRPSRGRDLRLHLRANREIPGLHSTHELPAGERLDLVLSWGRPRRHELLGAEALLARTAEAWRAWMRHFSYEGPEERLVRRAAVTLKLCDDWANGSLVAAPTSSLPAPVGGVRNWDYRYTWVRDAAFSVWALRRIGFEDEARGFLGWVLDAFESTRWPRIMYDVTGGEVPDEWEDPELEGYRGSAPVRWGNGAADQRQNDVYGEVLDCAHLWVGSGQPIDARLWERLAALADAAGGAWRQPDQGIWEVRSEGKVFTYSAAMCQVALDRAARVAHRLGFDERAAGWGAAAEQLRRTVLDGAWSETRRTLTEHLGGGDSLDASLLALPLRRVVAADDPRMVATTAAIAERLSAGDGLLFRYRHDESSDGIAGDEGAFLLCSFWLVDNLAKQGRVEEATTLYESLCARANPLGLLPEQIEPSTGEFAGNFPQAFSHVGVISSGVNIALATADS